MPIIRIVFWSGLCLAVAGVFIGGGWQPGEGVSQRSDPGPAPSSRGGEEVISEMNMMLAADQIEALKQAATRGDIGAATSLANHYSELGQAGEEARWLSLAANRGHCGSMALLRGNAERAGDRPGAAHWNEMLRRNTCTWGKAYPEVANPDLASFPLWNEQ